MCVCVSDRVGFLAAAARHSKQVMESPEQRGNKENLGCVSALAGSVCVWLCKRACVCFRCRVWTRPMPVQACKRFTQPHPGNGGGAGGLTWGPGKGEVMSIVGVGNKDLMEPEVSEGARAAARPLILLIGLRMLN